MTHNRVASRLSRTIDTALDRSVVPGFSRIGSAIRSRLPDRPHDPAADALVGCHVLVTGATSGIGTAVAEQLHTLGATVHLLVRDTGKGDLLATRLGDRAQVWSCDLADFESIRRCAKALCESGITIDAIVHNAGVLPAERSETPQGHELTMGVHVLGPVLLTDLLADRLAVGARIVFVTSGGMYTQRLPVADPEFRRGEYAGATAYARSKRTQVDLLAHFGARWPTAQVHAMHPGWVATPGVSASLPTFAKVMRPVLRTPGDGADTITWLIASTPPPVGGGLWHDRRRRPTTILPGTRSTPAQRDRLWEWVCTATGLTTTAHPGLDTCAPPPRRSSPEISPAASP